MPTEFNDDIHFAMFKGTGAYRTGNAFDVRWSEIVLASLRAAGFLDNMEDGTVPPTIDKLWLDKNFDPAILKEWDPIGSNWQQVSNQTLFGRVPWRGPWEASPIYRRADLVSYQGNIWIAVQPSQNQAPAENAYWDLFLTSFPDNSVSTVKLVDKAVTNAKLADVATLTFKGRTTAGSGSPEDLTLAQAKAMLNPLRGFNGDGATSDSANFTTLEASVSGNVIDLQGKTYLVTSIPTANMYVNGFWKIGSLVYDALEWSSFIASASDTGGIETAYSGGTLPLLAPSGRSTAKTIGLLWSQNSRSEFVRAVNVGSIYSWAKGNVSGNYSARNCLAWVPQSVNLASEECWAWGGFRGVNLGSFTSGCENESNFNLGTRGSYATGRNSGNVASTGARAGRGGGIRLTVTPVAGAINTGTITIDQPGARYQIGDSLVFFDRSGSPTVIAIATITATDVNGGATAVTVSTDGVGYSSRVDATVDNGTGDFSANIACSGFTETIGEASAVIASLGGAAAYVKASGKNSAVIASEIGSEASGNMSVVLASTAGIASGQISAAIAANNSQATAQESVVFGRRTINPTTRELAGGENNTGLPLSSNRKWSISNVTGVFKSVTTFSASGTFADFGEYFENRDRGVIPYGTIVMLEDDKIIPWDGEGQILGVVSATVAFMGNDADWAWQGRYLKDEFGAEITEEILDPDWQAEIPDPSFRRRDEADEVPMIPNPMPQGMVTVKVENPEYDPSKEHVARSQRRDQWSPIGLLGQVFTRVPEHICVGDVYGDRLQVMKITTPFNAAKGYAVARCFVR